MKIFMALLIWFLLSGCESVPLKDGELYLDQHTSVGMDGLGVAKMRNKF